MPKLGMEIKRKCKFCGKAFIIKTLDSIYCCKKCTEAAYAQRKRTEAKERKLALIAKSVPKVREFISIREVTATYKFPVMPHTPKGLISYILVDIPCYCVKRIWHSKHIRNLLLIILICLWTIFMGVTGFIIRDNVALHERMQLIELQWRK